MTSEHEAAMRLVMRWERDLVKASDADPKKAFAILMLAVCGVTARLYLAGGRDMAMLAAMAEGCDTLAKTVRLGALN